MHRDKVTWESVKVLYNILSVGLRPAGLCFELDAHSGTKSFLTAAMEAHLRCEKQWKQQMQKFILS